MNFFTDLFTFWQPLSQLVLPLIGTISVHRWKWFRQRQQQ